MIKALLGASVAALLLAVSSVPSSADWWWHRHHHRHHAHLVGWGFGPVGWKPVGIYHVHHRWDHAYYYWAPYHSVNGVLVHRSIEVTGAWPARTCVGSGACTKLVVAW